MKIVFTNPAKGRLREIHYYYKKFVSARVAERIRRDVITKAKALTSFPEMGQREPHLVYLKKNHRLLVPTLLVLIAFYENV